MKRIIYIFLTTVLIYACKKDSGIERDITYGCKIEEELGFLPQITSKAHKTKGFMLFSWKNIENNWNYSIIQNLNSKHNKVEANYSFTGEKCLKKMLLHYEGLKIYWTGTGSIETLEGKNLNLSYPPSYIVRDMKLFCESINVKLLTEYDI